MRKSLITLTAVIATFGVLVAPFSRVAADGAVSSSFAFSSVRSYKSTAVMSDGLAAILLSDSSTESLTYMKCLNEVCDQRTAPVTFATGVVNTSDYTLVTQPNGMPMIWYRNAITNRLTYVSCSSVDCSTSSQPVALNSSSATGNGVKAILAPNNKVWAFWRASVSNDIYLAKCSDAVCSQTTISVVASVGNIGYALDVQKTYCSEADRNAEINPQSCVMVVSVQNGSRDDVLFSLCNADCSTATNTYANHVLPYTMPNLGGNSLRVEVQPSGLPIVIRLVGSGNIETLYCQDLLCTDFDSHLINGLPAVVGGQLAEVSSLFASSIESVSGEWGSPLLYFTNTTTGNLSSIQCTSINCGGTFIDYNGTAGAPAAPVGDGPSAVGLGSSKPFVVTNNGNTVQTLIASQLVNLYQPPHATTLQSFTVANTPSNYFPTVISANGFPAFLESEAATKSLNFYNCLDDSCANQSNPVTFGVGAVQSTHYALIRQSSGLPMIWYRDSTSNTLKYVRCSNADCSNSAAPTTVVSGGGAGTNVKAILAPNGNVWAFWKKTSGNDLMVTKCLDVQCSSASTNVVYATGNAGAIPQPTLGYCSEADRINTHNPNSCVIVASISSGMIDNVVLSVCSVDCSTATSTMIAGQYTMPSVTATQLQSLTLTNGLSAVIRNISNNRTELIQCQELSCSTFVSNIVSTDTQTSMGMAAISGGSNRLPLLFFNSASTKKLTSLQCVTFSCDPSQATNTIRSYNGQNGLPNVANPAGVTSIISVDGLPFIVSRNTKTIQLTY